jgi:molybdopterin converting factor small subunit
MGREQDVLEVPPEIGTIGALAGHVEKIKPELAGRLAAVRWAKNEEFAAMSTPIADGDVIALIPPVAGGSR